MNFCPNCGRKLKQVHPVSQPTADEQLVVPRYARNEQALSSLLAKIKDMAKHFDAMNEDEWDNWIDGLEQDEFIEFIGMGNEVIGRQIALHSVEEREPA